MLVFALKSGLGKGERMDGRKEGTKDRVCCGGVRRESSQVVHSVRTISENASQAQEESIDENTQYPKQQRTITKIEDRSKK
jgi:hypothetical protein